MVEKGECKRERNRERENATIKVRERIGNEKEIEKLKVTQLTQTKWRKKEKRRGEEKKEKITEASHSKKEVKKGGGEERRE